MVTAIELKVRNIVEDLQILAESPTLAAGDFARFSEYMTTANQLMGAYGTFLVDRSGQMLISTRRLPGEQLPQRNFLETQEKVFASGQPQVSGLINAASSENPIVSVEVPVRVGGEIRYVLAAGLSPGYFAEIMKKLVPPEWIGSIVDQHGILSSPGPDRGGARRRIVPSLLAQGG